MENYNKLNEEQMLLMEGQLLDLQLQMEMGLLPEGGVARIRQLKADIIRNL